MAIMHQLQKEIHFLTLRGPGERWIASLEKGGLKKELGVRVIEVLIEVLIIHAHRRGFSLPEVERNHKPQQKCLVYSLTAEAL